MKKRFSVAVTAAFVGAARLYAADATTMICQGVSHTYGHNAPKRIHFDADYQSSDDMLVIASDRKWASGLLLNTDTRLTLCRETSTELLYSFNCSANWLDYVNDWTSSGTQNDASKLMAKKYGEHWTDFETITVNRLDLTVVAKYMLPEFSRNVRSLKPGEIPSPADITDTLYVRATEYSGSCKIEKAKI